MSTEVGFGPLERIDGPPPIAPTYGLLQAATAPAAGVRIVPDVDERGIERWMNGAEVYPYPPDQGDVFDPCASGSDYAPKGEGDALEHPKFGAMTVWLAETCTSYKVWNQDEYKARAVAAFTAVESSIIARELMNGTRLPANPYLADAVNTDFPTGDTPLSVLQGLATLEDAIAATGRQGLIHCSPGIGTLMRERFTVDTKTGVLRTVNGIVVIPDFGYVNANPPTGHSVGANQEWIYATGPIDVRRSEVFVTPDNVSQAVDRGTPGSATVGIPNSITYRVERYALVDWDTELHAAVLVDRCIEPFTCGS